MNCSVKQQFYNSITVIPEGPSSIAITLAILSIADFVAAWAEKPFPGKRDKELLTNISFPDFLLIISFNTAWEQL